MDKRWVRIAVVAAGLFLINVLARLVIRIWYDGDDSAQNRVSVIMFAIIGVALAAVTFVRSQHVRPSRWLPELAAAAIGGMLLTLLLGPFVSGAVPFDGGAGNFFSQVWIYSGFAVLGVLLGHWLATALGRDHRSRSLAAYTKLRSTKPRRVVRR